MISTGSLPRADTGLFLSYCQRIDSEYLDFGQIRPWEVGQDDVEVDRGDDFSKLEMELQ
tara:strand:- start:94 stop:270 length:177 start_codon:yes stop_codon:yes gene_type:complete